jgi:hypothetical protein
LAIYVLNFFETFYTYYFNSPNQDPIIESKKKIKKVIYAIFTRSGSFRMFLFSNVDKEPSNAYMFFNYDKLSIGKLINTSYQLPNEIEIILQIFNFEFYLGTT